MVYSRLYSKMTCKVFKQGRLKLMPGLKIKYRTADEGQVISEQGFSHFITHFIKQMVTVLLHRFSLTIAFFLLACAVQADGLDENSPFSSLPEVVSDAEMAQMRGRFIRQGRPIYFGISMQSQWSTATGASINVGMNIGINLRKDIATDNRITIGVQLDDVADSAAGDIPAAVIPSSDVNIGGLDSAQGVVQAITVSGDDNQAHNRTFMTMQLVSADQAEPGGEVYYFGGQNLSIGQTAAGITSGTSQTDKNGVVTTAFVDESGVGIKIEVPDQGMAMQLLRGKSKSREGSGFFQTIQIEGGNGNKVVNQLNFISEFSPLDGNANIISIQPALDSLKLIQGIGIQ